MRLGFHKKVVGGRLGSWLSAHGVDAIVAFLCLVFSWWLMASTFGYANGQFIIASKLWSDFGAHIPLLRSFSMGANWPPEYPQFSGEPIRYHYLFYLLVGLLERVGLRLDIALNLLSAFGFWLLLWMLYSTAKLFFKSKAAGVLSVILFLSNGSLNYIRFFENLSSVSIQGVWEDLKGLTSFLSFGPWDGQNISAFWTLNIYTNQRHLGLGFAVLLALLYPLFERVVVRLSERAAPFVERKKMGNSSEFWRNWCVPLVLAVFPLLHQAAYLSFIMLASLWLLLYWRHFSLRWLAPYVVGFVASVGAVLSISQGSAGHHLVLAFGYLSKAADFDSFIRYWFDNLGLYLPLLFVVALAAPWKYRRLILISLPLFIAANTILFSPDMINNHKLLNVFFLFLVLVAAGLLADWWKQGWQKKVLVCIFLPFLLFSGVLDLVPIIRDTVVYLPDYKMNESALWIANNTPPQSRFLTTVYFHSAPSLVGRRTFLDYGYYAWSMGYDDASRRELLHRIFAQDTTTVEVCRILEENALDYLYVTKNTDLATDIVTTRSAFLRASVPLLRTSQGDAIYSVSQTCSQ